MGRDCHDASPPSGFGQLVFKLFCKNRWVSVPSHTGFRTSVEGNSKFKKLCKLYFFFFFWRESINKYAEKKRLSGESIVVDYLNIVL